MINTVNPKQNIARFIAPPTDVCFRFCKDLTF
jgi:hypothetical protein